MKLISFYINAKQSLVTKCSQPWVQAWRGLICQTLACNAKSTRSDDVIVNQTYKAVLPATFSLCELRLVNIVQLIIQTNIYISHSATFLYLLPTGWLNTKRPVQTCSLCLFEFPTCSVIIDTSVQVYICRNSINWIIMVNAHRKNVCSEGLCASSSTVTVLTNVRATSLHTLLGCRINLFNGTQNSDFRNQLKVKSQLTVSFHVRLLYRMNILHLNKFFKGQDFSHIRNRESLSIRHIFFLFISFLS